MIGKILAAGLFGLGFWEYQTGRYAIAERFGYWRMAKAYAKEVGKPTLLIGLRRHLWHPPNDADVIFDLNPDVLRHPRGIQGDVRDMPFEDKEFGAVMNEHVLEHLETPEDVELAVRECARVADMAVFLCPHPYSLANLINPLHTLRLWFNENRITVEYMRKPKVRSGRVIDQAVILYSEDEVEVITR